MNAEVPFALIGGGDCTLHFHSEDRAPTHDSLERLEQLVNQVVVTGNYAARYADDLLQVTNGAVVTFPPARNGKEFEVVQMDTNPCSVAFTAPDTLFGSSTASLTIQGMALRFKAITGGWVLI